jgi:hypothetical protein
MPKRQVRQGELIAVLKAKAAAAPGRQNELLVRHLKCKETLELADAVTSALVRYHAHDAHGLPAPTEVLPPLQ